MSNHRSRANRPSPGPLCVAYAPLLPLLSTGALTGEEERAVHEHAAACTWCQHELATYAIVDQAVREYQGADPTVGGQGEQRNARPGRPFAQSGPTGERHLTLEDIMKASEQSSGQFGETNESGARNHGWSNDDEMTPRPRRGRGVLATVGAIAATLLIVVLAASLFSRLGQRGPSVGSSPATATVTVPSATATVPAAPTCNSNFANSPIHGAQTSIEGVPLPPVTYVVPDNAAGLHGYDLCSSGTVASVSAYLTNSLPSAGWTKVSSDARCFYENECWTKGTSAISWQVTDPTLWHIAYHPSAG